MREDRIVAEFVNDPMETAAYIRKQLRSRDAYPRQNPVRAVILVHASPKNCIRTCLKRGSALLFAVSKNIVRYPAPVVSMFVNVVPSDKPMVEVILEDDANET